MANHSAYGALRNVLLVSVLVLVGGTVHAKASTPVDVWKGTDLDFDFIRTKVTSQSCQQSEQEFLACINAIQALLDHNAKGLLLVQVQLDK